MSRIEVVCAVLTAVAAIAGSVIAYQEWSSRDDPTDLSGDIVGAYIESTSPAVVRGQFELKGFRGKSCSVVASVFDASSGQPVSGLTDQPAIALIPEAHADRAVFPMSVRLPTAPGTYFVTLVLLDPDGHELDRHNTAAIQIGPAGTGSVTTADPNAFPNGLERTLLSHVPAASNTRCQRAGPLNLGDTAGVRCEPSLGASAVWYYQFADVERLRNAYAASLTRTGISGGMCNSEVWRGAGSYSAANIPTGQRLCYEATDGRQWIEWTNERLLIFARANSPDYRVLLDWWINSAGPI